MRKLLLFVAIAVALGLQSNSFGNSSGLDVDIENISIEKQTSLEKYLTSKQAYQILSKQPDILFIDVRDTIEIARSGHPTPIDAIVPLKIQTSVFDPELGEFILEDNPNFAAEILDVLEAENKTREEMIILTCGSGMRSAKAVERLVALGYTDVWHIPDGYDGEDKPGLNTQNAWKLAGLPWSHDIIHGSEWRLIIKD